ncbi:MAG: hypothetical protein IPL79_11910 [Myxococcales bacterium]|nr:hypothetical protein [Myxococcales bacterium]
MKRILMAAGLAVSLAVGVPASAATYYVGPGTTLRQAVDLANAHPGNDTILLVGSISTLSQCPGPNDDDYHDNNLNGDLDVNDPSGGSLTLQPLNWGGDVAPVTLTTKCTQRLIDNRGPGPLIIRGIILSGGHALTEGGAIRSLSAPLTLDRVTLKNNVADWGGGAVSLKNYPLSITNSLFENNATVASPSYQYSSGGAVYFSNSLVTISNTQFNHNSASSNGGAILGESGSLDITSSWFEGNVAIAGGALHLLDVDATVGQSEFRYNLAQGVTGAAGVGGGVRAGCSTVTPWADPRDEKLHPLFTPDCALALTDTDFSVNVASDQGGGLWVDQMVASIEGGQFLGNHTDGYGGGAYYYRSHGPINNALFHSNSAGEAGGGVYFDLNGYLNAATNNSFTHNTAGVGAGGFFIGGGSLAWITGGNFEGNEAQYGGGLMVGEDARVYVSQALIKGNKGTMQGGGVHEYTSIYTELSRTTVEQNTSDEGGGVWGTNLFVVDSTITQNTAAGRGGGVYGYYFFVQGVGVSLASSTVDHNHVYGTNGGLFGGGGLFGRVATNNVTVAYNTAKDNLGSAVYIPSGGKGHFFNTTVTRNGIDAVQGGEQVRVQGRYLFKHTYVGEDAGSDADCYFSGATAETFTTGRNNYATDATCWANSLPFHNTANGIPAQFGNFGNYGGFTQTLRMYSSPIVDYYPCLGPLDQRHKSRPQGAACDVGATEYGTEDFPGAPIDTPYPWPADAWFSEYSTYLTGAGEAAPDYPRMELTPR